MLTLDGFLALAWKSYSELAPDAPVIHTLLEQRGEKIQNDHVAFRTFDLPGISRREVGEIFKMWGYVQAPEELDFPEKKLKASYYLPADPTKPKIFVSELLTAKVSAPLREWIRATAKAPAKLTPEYFLEPTWSAPSYADYRHFYQESEYAAWTAAFGVRVNHFTVFVNSLKTFSNLAELNEFLTSHGIQLNTAGGTIKGSPKELLEQTSTMAKAIPHQFADQKATVLGCYYEFARRYAGPDGKLFQGFVPKSADKIFESTFEKK